MPLTDAVAATHLLRSEGFVEGEMSTEPGWYIIWLPEEVEQYNREFELPSYAPDYVAFGQDGGNELLVLDSRGAVFMLPAIGMSSDSARCIADSIVEFKNRMKRG